jgi:excisionase family DNA binding protein
MGIDLGPEAMTPDEAPALTISEAAARAGVAEKTVRRMIKAGSLPHLKQAIPGGFRYLVPPEVVALIAHVVGDRVLPDGIPSPLQTSLGGQDTQSLHGSGTQARVPSSDASTVELQRQRDALRDRVSEISQERDEWKTLAKDAQETIRALSETIQRLNETNRQLALPEHRETEEEPADLSMPRRGFWHWFLGR